MGWDKQAPGDINMEINLDDSKRNKGHVFLRRNGNLIAKFWFYGDGTVTYREWKDLKNSRGEITKGEVTIFKPQTDGYKEPNEEIAFIQGFGKPVEELSLEQLRSQKEYHAQQIRYGKVGTPNVHVRLGDLERELIKRER